MILEIYVCYQLDEFSCSGVKKQLVCARVHTHTHTKNIA